MLSLRALPPHVSLDRSDEPAWGTLAFGAIAAIFLIDAINLVYGSQRKGAITLVFENVSDQGSAVAAYLATYLLPFLGLTPSKLGDWLAYGVYLCVGLVIFANSNLALVNPTLYVLGWRVVMADRAHPFKDSELPTFDSSSVIVVCKEPLKLPEGVEVVRFAGGYVTKREKKRERTG